MPDAAKIFAFPTGLTEPRVVARNRGGIPKGAPQVLVADAVLFPDSVFEAFKRDLAPLNLDGLADEVSISFRGTDAQARAAPLLQGHGLPGDPGCNKTSYFFHADDGRRISVERGVYKTGAIVAVWVYPTRAERAVINARDVLKREAELKQKQKDMADALSPERYRSMVNGWIGLVGGAVRTGNEFGRDIPVSTCRFSSEDTAAAMEALATLQKVVANAKIVHCGPVARPSLSLIAS